MVNVPPDVAKLDGDGFASSLQYWLVAYAKLESSIGRISMVLLDELGQNPAKE